MGYRLPFATTIAIFLLLIGGGLVVGFDAGLACSDWPLCNGKVIPPMEGKIIIEYTHRMLSTVIGFMILGNLYAGWRKRKESPLASKLAYLSVVLLIIVAVLGGVNVLHKLPPGFTSMDVSVAMLLFSTYVLLTAVTLSEHRRKTNQFHPDKRVRSLYKPALVATIAIYVQFVLGAFIKHSDAGAIWVKGELRLLNSIVSSSVVAEGFGYAHMFATFIISGAVMFTLFYSLQKKVARELNYAMAGLLTLQIVAGFITLISKLAVVADIVHLALGALMLGVGVFMTAQAKIGAELVGRRNLVVVPDNEKSRENIS
ncbi:COX15/CtaA family protein [Aneurinibacillus tyrosinisolvens]|uniref:COX15/CtaA family protein n=1 Tax=Aneurinibacillus tyrosinisolvens TaxID=1443435 RepID=UPI00063F2660|nr:COX15/CtaA family protein [Aneurinibacillus tyrosinisolvens]